MSKIRFLIMLVVLLLLGGALYLTPALAASTYYEAEDAVVGGGAVVNSNNAGFLGTGYVNFNQSGGYVEFRNVDGRTGDCCVQLKLRYRLASTGSRTGRLTVNGVSKDITFSPTTSWATKIVSVALTSGTTNTIRLQSTGQDLANLDNLEVSIITTPPPPSYQAEAANIMVGASVGSGTHGYVGTGYVSFFYMYGGYIEFRNVSFGRVLRFRYSLASGSRTGHLTVNGASQSITFSPTGAWTTWATKDVAVTLTSGASNTIRLTSTGQGMPLLDQLEVRW